MKLTYLNGETKEISIGHNTMGRRIKSVEITAKDKELWQDPRAWEWFVMTVVTRFPPYREGDKDKAG